MAYRPAGYLEREEDEEGFYFGDDFGEEELASYRVKQVVNSLRGEEQQHVHSTDVISRKCTVSYEDTSPASPASRAPDQSNNDTIRFAVPSVIDQIKCEDENCALNDDSITCVSASGVEGVGGVGAGGAFSRTSLPSKQKEKTSRSFLKNLESTVDMRVAIAKGNTEQVAMLLDEGMS